MKRVNSKETDRTLLIRTYLIAGIVLLFGLVTPMTNHAGQEVLLLVKNKARATEKSLQDAGASLYYRSDRYLLAGLDVGRVSLPDAAAVQIIDRNAWSDGTVYYWVMARGPEKKALTLFSGVKILFREEGLALVKARPEDADRLPNHGFEIVRVHRRALPFIKTPAPAGLPGGSRDFGGVIDGIVGAVSQAQYTDYLQTLEDFQTRYTYTDKIDDAADWIYDTFRDFGLDVERHYFDIHGYTKQNIIATRTGTVSPDEVVLITAHYDCTSNDPWNNAPGADDNGSGTAAVIEAARVMSNYNFERTVKFACFSGEEQGLYGSYYYAQDILSQGMNMIGCFNYDMIAWSGFDTAPPDLIIFTDTASTALAEELRDAALYYCPVDLEPFIYTVSSGASDHVSFWQFGYRAIHAIEGYSGSEFNPYYHSTNDLVSNCDLEYATNCTKAATAAVADYAGALETTRTYLLTGPGPGYGNPPEVRVFPPRQDAARIYDFMAYGTPYYGANVACGNVYGNGFDYVITGAGPGTMFGPHVRGFRADGAPITGLNFMAYGTARMGVNVAAADVDGDGYDEILTGPGPARIFGPHVRAFNFDGAPSITPVPGVNFMAYGTRQFGVKVAGGDVDGDGIDEIVTGPGPGPVFGPHVRGWNIDGAAAAPIGGINFFAYPTQRYGVNVSTGDLNGDGREEMVTAPGPCGYFGAHIRGWRYDGSSTTALSGGGFFAWPSSQAHFGASVFAGGDLDDDGRDELIIGAGPGANMPTSVLVLRYTGDSVTPWFSLTAYPHDWRYGVNVAGGKL